MQVTNEMLKFWDELYEDGDVTVIAKEIKRDISTASRILNGKTRNISTKHALAINKFYQKRKAEQKRATQIDTD